MSADDDCEDEDRETSCIAIAIPTQERVQKAS